MNYEQEAKGKDMKPNCMLIRPDGTHEDIYIDHRKEQSFEDIIDAIDCRIFQVVPNVYDAPYDMYCDEEFLCTNEPPEFNVHGSLHYGWGDTHFHPILGNVLVVGRPDEEGYTTDLSMEELDDIRSKMKLKDTV